MHQVISSLIFKRQVVREVNGIVTVSRTYSPSFEARDGSASPSKPCTINQGYNFSESCKNRRRRRRLPSKQMLTGLGVGLGVGVGIGTYIGAKLMSNDEPDVKPTPVKLADLEPSFVNEDNPLMSV